MITKEQFLNGVEFTINKIGNYRFKPTESEYLEGSIERVYRNTKGEQVLIDHEANVEKITNKTVTYYSSLMGQFVKKKAKFSNMEMYVQPIEVFEGQ